MIRVAGRAMAVLAAISVTLAPLPARADRLILELLEPTPAVMVQSVPATIALVKSYGPSGAPASGKGGDGNGGLEFGESEINSLGCVVGGSVGMGAALAIGGINISNLIAGGLVPAASPAALYASLFGVVFATFCAVGQAVTPVAIYAYRRYFDEPGLPPPLVRPSPDSVPEASKLRRTIAEAR